MVVFVNSRGEIKDVGSTKQVDLIGIVLRDEENPFKDWSIAKICCYRIETFDGYVTMMTPYIDSRLIDHFDQIGQSTEVNKSDISDNRDGLMETFETGMTNSDDITTLRNGLMEVYEMMLGSEVK